MMTDDKKEELKQRFDDWMSRISRVIILLSPLIIWVWSLWWESQINELETAFEEKFISKSELVYLYDKRKDSLATAGQFTKLNGIVQTHQADSGQHYPKSAVVGIEKFEAQIAVTQGILNRVDATLNELKVDERQFKAEFRQFVSEYYKNNRN